MAAAEIAVVAVAAEATAGAAAAGAAVAAAALAAEAAAAAETAAVASQTMICSSPPRQLHGYLSDSMVHYGWLKQSAKTVVTL